LIVRLDELVEVVLILASNEGLDFAILEVFILKISELNLNRFAQFLLHVNHHKSVLLAMPSKTRVHSDDLVVATAAEEGILKRGINHID